MNVIRNKKVLSSLVIALLLSGGGWYWLVAGAVPAQAALNKPDSGRRADGGRAVPVLTGKIKISDLRIVQTAIGTAIPSSMLTLRSQVNGQLQRVLFKEGQLVRAGEVLAEIDPRSYQAQLTQAQGQALHNQALLKNALLDLERFRTLQTQDSIAAQQVDAQSALVQQYQGTVLTDQGLVANAKLQLEFTRIRSAITGRIGLRQIDVGNNITTADTLAVVTAIYPIQVVFTLSEARVANIIKRQQQAGQSGHGLPVEAWDRGNTVLLAKGVLLSVDNQIDATSGTIKLKAQFINHDASLFPNQFVNIHLLSDTLHDVVTAPKAAIQLGSAGAFVYVVAEDGKDKKVMVRQVTPGASDGDLIAIEHGLKAGDQVVISGVDRLREGARIIISSGDKGEGKKRAKSAEATAGNKNQPEHSHRPS